jgi:hypothetical protein
VVFCPNTAYNSYYVFAVIVVIDIVGVSFIVCEDVFVLVGLKIYAVLRLLMWLAPAFLEALGFGLSGRGAFALCCSGLYCGLVILICMMIVLVLGGLIRY